MEFSIKCYDNTSFISDDLTLFDPKSPILKKRIRSIEMVMHPDKNTFVKIGLFHGSDYDSEEKEYSNSSFMELGSNDTMWVNGFAGKLHEWLDGVTVQVDVLEKNSRLIYFSAFITGTLLFGVIWDIYRFNAPGYVAYWRYVLTGFDAFPRIFAASIAGGGVLFLIIGHYMGKSPDIWPIVELQTGPDHLMKEKAKRQHLNMVWTLILLPFILSIISSIVFSFIMK